MAPTQVGTRGGHTLPPPPSWFWGQIPLIREGCGLSLPPMSLHPMGPPVPLTHPPQQCSWALVVPSLVLGHGGVPGTPIFPSRLCPQAQQRRREGGGAEARFSELVERYKRKILGSDPPAPKRSKWFES